MKLSEFINKNLNTVNSFKNLPTTMQTFLEKQDVQFRIVDENILSPEYSKYVLIGNFDFIDYKQSQNKIVSTTDEKKFDKFIESINSPFYIQSN